MCCWYCKYGWPKPIRDIYDWAVQIVGESDLTYGYAHIVWGDENFDWAERLLAECPDDVDTVVKESLRRLAQVPMEMREMPDSDFEPPAEWQCEHR